MLGAIRKRKNSPIVLFILGLALLAMAAFGISAKGLGSGQTEAAMVNGEPILEADYAVLYARVFSQQQRNDRTYDRTKAEKDNLRARVLDEMVTQKILDQEAKKSHLVLDDEALRDSILSEEAFQVDGHFNKDLYQRYLSANQSTPERFEQSLREEKLAALLRVPVRNAHVSEEELKQAFSQERERVTLRYVQFNAQAFDAQVGTLTDADAKAWEEKPESKADEKIKAYYARYKSTRFDVPEQVCARHVMVRIAKDLPPDVRTKKRETLEKALAAVKGGMAFEEAAKKFSDDTTKDRGGDLGCFSAGQTVQRIEEEAFKLQPGQMSGIFESAFGLHFLKVTERKPPVRKKLEDVRGEIALALAREAKASDLAKAQASAVLAEAKKLGSLSKAVEARGKDEPKTKGKTLPTAQKTALTVETSQAFPQGRDFIPPLGVAPDVARAAWTLTTEAPLASEPLATERGWVAIELAERQSPTDEEFKASRPALLWHLSQRKAASLSEGWAKALRASADVNVNQAAISYDDNVRARLRQR
ncbi:MAG: SurA N-terminal domain-containing protein [Deltaproteobacteria bacterium]|nr:SurA N-terminal domain-containing protein [Deltaproteobacteria bacterium]